MATRRERRRHGITRPGEHCPRVWHCRQMLLKDGVRAADAEAALTNLIGQFEAVPGAWARPDWWQIVQNKYLQVVESAEMQLSSLFEDDDGTAAGLFSEGHRMIREMTDTTPRREPLVQAEVTRQARTLRNLRDSIAGLRALAERPGTPVMLDTNILLHYQRPDQIPWPEVVKAPVVRVVVPACVLDELDAKKYASGATLGRRARDAIKALRTYADALVPGAAAVIGDNATLEVLADEPGHSRRASADDEILNRALLLKRVTGLDVRVVTADLGMQLRAATMGIRYHVMPDKYSKDALSQSQLPEQ